ncbi:MAG: fibronectin type III domain-containing protein, partial [Proteobacteria bacterium]|nr:fibronectin type III domain-containing protein [Pseudomonadota bacterium]
LNYDISTWADESPTVRFAFVFAGEFFNDGASWWIDDFLITGTGSYDDEPPVALNANPSQPMIGSWNQLSGQVGCTFMDPAGVDASTVQIRVDANGDADYDDGGTENWSSIEGLADSDSLVVQTEIAFTTDGDELHFEFRAKDLADSSPNYGYSGFLHQEGMQDDWAIRVYADLDLPHFSDATPINQPEPDWVNALVQEVTVTVADSAGLMEASSIQMRVDFNHDGIYALEGDEAWQPLNYTGQVQSIYINETLTLPEDGEYRVEFQATDYLGNGPAFSMNQEGILDDIVLRADTTPPTASTLFVMGAGANTVDLAFSPTQDLSFTYYEIYWDTTETVDETDWRVGPELIEALATQSTMQVTLEDLFFGNQHYFRIRAFDEVGHEGAWSNTVSALCEGIAPMAVTDLHIESVEGGVRLSWS